MVARSAADASAIALTAGGGNAAALALAVGTSLGVGAGPQAAAAEGGVPGFASITGGMGGLGGSTGGGGGGGIGGFPGGNQGQDGGQATTPTVNVTTNFDASLLNQQQQRQFSFRTSTTATATTSTMAMGTWCLWWPHSSWACSACPGFGYSAAARERSQKLLPERFSPSTAAKPTVSAVGFFCWPRA